MSDIVMPRLSDTMEEGTVLRWLKRDGDQVKRGEELVEIETDKANMTYESDRDGVLQTVAREGDTLAVGELIAHIGEPSDVLSSTKESPDSERRPDGHAAPGEARAQAPAGNGAAPRRSARVKASPLARRLAREAGVDLRSLSGSGPGGRIVKADVQASVRGAPPRPALERASAMGHGGAQPTPAPDASQPAAPAPPTTAPTVRELATAKGEVTSVELSRMQRTIARRMAESKATVPHFTLTADVDMERCVELRRELGRLAQAPSGDGARAPTYNDMIVKACALALREHPRANGSYRDGRFELHSRVNVGVAVAVDAEDTLRSALVVSTVFDADSKSLGEIARETRALAARVRDGSITPPELSGATFTVSNLGMYGVTSFTAIVNPPQAAILAVGAVQRRPVLAGGPEGPGADAPGPSRHMMSVTLSCDHRILYGADAALFLARVRELLQEPAALTL